MSDNVYLPLFCLELTVRNLMFQIHYIFGKWDYIEMMPRVYMSRGRLSINCALQQNYKLSESMKIQPQGIL